MDRKGIILKEINRRELQMHQRGNSGLFDPYRRIFRACALKRLVSRQHTLLHAC